MTYDLLPEHIKEIRNELHLTQVQFAESLGLGLDTIKSYEVGRAIPSYDVMMAICDMAGVEFRIRPEKKHPALLKKLDAKKKADAKQK